MKSTLEGFRQNLQRVRSIHAIYLNFSEKVTEIVDLTDILRTEVVLTVSALDYFMHELTRQGMMEVWRRVRPPTPAYLRFSVSLDVVTNLLGGSQVDAYLESEIRTRHGYLAFQHPDKIADAVRLFSEVELWREVGVLMKKDTDDIKKRLKLLVERRNKIAHEADADPSYPGQRWPITTKDAEDAIEFVTELGEAIYQAVM
jgi:hypothetical protein